MKKQRELNFYWGVSLKISGIGIGTKKKTPSFNIWIR